MKTVKVISPLTSGLNDSGRFVVMDSGFPTLKLMKDS